MPKKSSIETLNEVHYIAEKFLEDPWAPQAHTYVCESTNDGVVCEVLLVREQTPQYFFDYKNGKVPLWTYDKKLAKRVALTDSEAWIDSLAMHGARVEIEVL